MAYETITFRPSKKNKTLLADIAKLAEQDNRKLNNYIETILLIWRKNNPLNDELAVGAVRQKKKKNGI